MSDQKLVHLLVEALRNLVDASDPFLADQGDAKDSRCGLVHPVTVEDCIMLSQAHWRAGDALDQLSNDFPIRRAVQALVEKIDSLRGRGLLYCNYFDAELIVVKQELAKAAQTKTPVK